MGNYLTMEDEYNSEESGDVIIEIGNYEPSPIPPRPIFMRHEEKLLDDRIDIELDLSLESDESAYDIKNDLHEALDKLIDEIEIQKPVCTNDDLDKALADLIEETYKLEESQLKKVTADTPVLLEAKHVSNKDLIDELTKDIPIIKVISVDKFPKQLARYAQLFDEPEESNEVVVKLLLKIVKIAVMRFPGNGDYHLDRLLLLPFIDEIFLRLTLTPKNVEKISVLYSECVSNKYEAPAELILTNSIGMSPEVQLQNSYLPTIAWQALVTANTYPNLPDKSVTTIVKYYLENTSWDTCDSTVFSSLTGIMIETEVKYPKLYQDCIDIITYDIPDYRTSNDILLCYLTIYVTSRVLNTKVPIMEHIEEFISRSENYNDSTCDAIDIIVNDMIDSAEYTSAQNILATYIDKFTGQPPDHYIILNSVERLYEAYPSHGNAILVAASLSKSMFVDTKHITPLFVNFMSIPDVERLLMPMLKNRMTDQKEIQTNMNDIYNSVVEDSILRYTGQKFPQQLWDLILTPVRNNNLGAMKTLTLLMGNPCIEYQVYKNWILDNWDDIVGDNSNYLLQQITRGASIFHAQRKYLIEAALILKIISEKN